MGLKQANRDAERDEQCMTGRELWSMFGHAGMTPARVVHIPAFKQWTIAQRPQVEMVWYVAVSGRHEHICCITFTDLG